MFIGQFVRVQKQSTLELRNSIRCLLVACHTRGLTLCDLAARRVAGADKDEADAEDEAVASSALSSCTVARRDEGRDDGREGEATGDDSCLGVSCGTRL
jgi:hypothetical protein